MQVKCFFFITGKPENESVAGARQKAASETAPFVFSPPVHWTRARSSNQSAKSSVDQPISDEVPQTKIDKPVTRKSKR